MRFVRLDPAPVFLGFGAFTPDGLAHTVALAPAESMAQEGEPVSRHRFLDRYGALGCAAASAALADAGVTPGEQLDPEWGVTIGSSLGCGTSSILHDRELRDKPAAELSPALFVRTVSNAVIGDISMTHRLGGASETLVSGWSAGAEAIASACAALAEGRARYMLAGGVEAPDARIGKMHTAFRREADLPWLTERLSEGAVIAVIGQDRRATGRAPLRLRAYGRGHDPAAEYSLAEALDALRPLRFQSIVIANSVPPGLMDRWRSEAGKIEIHSLPQQAGELGAAGAPAAIAAACARRLESVLVIARGVEGGIVALALGC